MSPFISPINSLHPAIATSAIKVRVVRAYEVFFNGNANDSMSLECIFHDSEGTRIHATFGRNLLKTTTTMIKEGHCYVVHNFYIRPNHMRFKTTNHAYRIAMTQKTQICEVFDDDFPFHMFSFKSFQEIAAINDIADTPLFDIIGVIVDSSPVINQQNAKLIELKIEDENHNIVSCTLWEDYVDQFLNQVNPNVKQVPIMVIQFCRPSLYRGEIRICSSYNCSKVSLNQDIQEINDMRLRISEDGRFLETINLNFLNIPNNVVDETENLDVKSIEDVFCLEDGCHWICAKIDHVESNGEWWYLACKRCTKKVEKVDNRFYCDKCQKYDGIVNQRFMLRVNVVDSSGNATLLLWDRECVELLGKKVWEIEVEDDKDGQSCIIPQEIEEKLADRFCLFKVQMRNDADFRFDQPYTVTKICTNQHILDKYVAQILESQNSASTCKLSDISFGYDVEKISGSNFDSLNGSDLVENLDDEDIALGSVKRCFNKDGGDSTMEKKVKVKEDK